MRAKATDDNLIYCMEPLLGLIKQFSNLVEDSGQEIDSLNKMLENKNLDIAKL